MAATPTALTYSTTPITSTTPGEVIENLDLYVTGNQPAITVTSDDVTIRNVRIHVAGGDGIDVWANNATLSGIEVDGPAATNTTSGSGNDGVYAYQVTGLSVDHLTVRDVGAGVNAVQAPGTVLSYIEGHNMQGPYPSGQLVQLNQSDGSSLSHFYAQNDANASNPEDIVSVTSSKNVTISDGVIDGDNSPSGVGIMFEGDASGGQVSGVDAVHMGDGAFSSYSNDVSFDHVRAFDNIATDQGRGTPLSNGLIFAAEADGVSFTNATYTRPGDPDNILDGSPSTAQITENPSATVQAHITNVFSWSSGGIAAAAPSSPSVAPTVSILSETLAKDTGASATDKITANGAVTLTGTVTGVAGTSVAVVDGTQNLGAATVGSNGAWSFATTLSAGVHALKAVATNASGQSATSASAAAITVATAAPIITLGSETISSDGLFQTISGTVSDALPTTVAVYAGSTLMGPATLGSKGTWNYKANLPPGTYAITAIATDLAGNTASIDPELTVPTTGSAKPAGALDTLSLVLSEDAYKGDAQFTVSVDGHQVGGTQSVTALNRLGQTQTFTLSGAFGAGSHKVGINFLNDAFAGTKTTDRNLYVKSITLDGNTTAVGAGQYKQGTATYAAKSGTSATPAGLTVGAGATLILDAKAGANAAVTFAGSKGSLQLTDATSFKGSISGFAKSDAIDLRSISNNATAAATMSFSGSGQSGTLAISDGTHAASLHLNGKFAANSFHLASDLAGGSVITLV